MTSNAGNFRQHQVENDGVGLEGAHEFQAGLAVGRGLDLVTFHRELVAIDVGDDLVVFDDQNFFHV